MRRLHYRHVLLLAFRTEYAACNYNNNPPYWNFRTRHRGLRLHHRIIDDRKEKYGGFIVFISKKHCCAARKNVLADGRAECVADWQIV